MSGFQDIKILPSENTAKKLCRICYDTETEKNILIHPCRCTGSLKYVHEECLKTWLLSRNEDLAEKTCEICHTVFQMDYKISYISLGNNRLERLCLCIRVLFLLVFLVFLCLLFYRLILDYRKLPKGSREKCYHLVFMIGCAFGGRAILFFLVGSVKVILYRIKVRDWHIKSQELPKEFFVKLEEENSISHREESSVK